MIASQGKPAVAYYRMSTDRQETSIPDQRVAVEQFAKQHGYTILREYADEGISGDATDKRWQFQAMIAAAESREFSAILCWDIDRFGRFDSIEAGHWIYPLRRSGVHLATVAQGVIDWTDFAGRVIYGIQQEAKNQYLTDLSRNVTRGMMSLAEQGLWASGKPAFGYVAVDKRLVLGDAEDVALVRWMFEAYVGGKSLRTLAGEMNERGILSPKHKPWTANGISSLLRNRVYIGEYRWNVHCQSKYKRKGRPEQRNDPSEWIVFENHHPAIIDRDTFNAAQVQLTARKNCSTPVKNGGGFVLSGVLVCGKCGHNMIGDKSNGIHHYTCYGYRQRGSDYCDRNSLRQEDILTAVLDGIQEKFYNPETLKALAESMRRQLAERGRQPDIGATRRELAALEGKLEKAKRRLVEVDTDMLPVVQDQIRGLRQKQAALNDRLTACEGSGRTQGIEVDRIVKNGLLWFDNLRQAATKGEPTLLRQTIREAMERIELFAEKYPWTDKRFKYRLDRGVVILKPVHDAPEILAM